MAESQEIEIEKSGEDLQNKGSLGELLLAARTAKSFHKKMYLTICVLVSNK